MGLMKVVKKSYSFLRGVKGRFCQRGVLVERLTQRSVMEDIPFLVNTLEWVNGGYILISKSCHVFGLWSLLIS